jgi:hypothetical protein
MVITDEIIITLSNQSISLLSTSPTQINIYMIIILWLIIILIHPYYSN